MYKVFLAVIGVLGFSIALTVMVSATGLVKIKGQSVPEPVPLVIDTRFKITSHQVIGESPGKIRLYSVKDTVTGKEFVVTQGATSICSLTP